MKSLIFFAIPSFAYLLCARGQRVVVNGFLAECVGSWLLYVESNESLRAITDGVHEKLPDWLVRKEGNFSGRKPMWPRQRKWLRLIEF